MVKVRSGVPVALFILLLVVALAAAAGCSSDAGQAKQYAAAGDSLFNVVIGIGNRLDNTKASIQRLMVANDVAGLVAIEPQVRAIPASMDKSIQTLEKAVVQYRKVLELSGVDQYKEYVSIQSEAALKEEQALAVGRELANYVLGLIDAAKAGRPVNLNDSLRAVSSSVTNLDKLERELVALRRQAQDYATDHKLF
ncbi:MAG: hypothetical protein ACYC99_14290 [Candidatus Geothermincolia bacterium]